MIFTPLIYFGGFLMNIFILPFAFLTALVPNGFEQMLVYFFGNSYRFLNGLFDMMTLYAWIKFFMVLFGLMYFLKITLWFYQFIPFIGKQVELPFDFPWNGSAFGQDSIGNTMMLSNKRWRSRWSLPRNTGSSVSRKANNVRITRHFKH